MNLREAIAKALVDAQTAGHAHDVYLVRDTDGEFVVARCDNDLLRVRHAYVHIGTAFPDQCITKIQRYDAKTNSYIDEPTFGAALPGAFYYQDS